MLTVVKLNGIESDWNEIEIELIQTDLNRIDLKRIKLICIVIISPQLALLLIECSGVEGGFRTKRAELRQLEATEGQRRAR